MSPSGGIYIYHTITPSSSSNLPSDVTGTLAISGTYTVYGVGGRGYLTSTDENMYSQSIQLTNSQLKSGETRSSAMTGTFTNIGIGNISYTITLTLSNGDIYTHSVDSKNNG